VNEEALTHWRGCREKKKNLKHVTNPHPSIHTHTQKILAAGKQPALSSLICVVELTWLQSAALTALMAVSSGVLGMMFPTHITTIFLSDY
jgi:hypothetical protein